MIVWSVTETVYRILKYRCSQRPKHCFILGKKTRLQHFIVMHILLGFGARSRELVTVLTTDTSDLSIFLISHFDWPTKDSEKLRVRGILPETEMPYSMLWNGGREA